MGVPADPLSEYGAAACMPARAVSAPSARAAVKHVIAWRAQARAHEHAGRGEHECRVVSFERHEEDPRTSRGSFPSLDFTFWVRDLSTLPRFFW